MTKFEKLNKLLNRETKKNLGKYVAVDIETLKVVAIGRNLKTVDAKAAATGHRYTTGRDTGRRVECVAL